MHSSQYEDTWQLIFNHVDVCDADSAAGESTRVKELLHSNNQPKDNVSTVIVDWPFFMQNKCESFI